MARIDIRDTITYERGLVYETFRDDLKELAAYLPNIREIVVERHERTDESTVSVVNIWKATGEEIPTMARSFINPDMLQWTDRATWHDGSCSCDWIMEVGFLPQAVSCSGTTTYTARGDRTEVHITGELRVDAAKIPGVPRLLSGKIGGAVEEFVIKLITPNLKEVNRGAEKYLASRG